MAQIGSEPNRAGDVRALDRRPSQVGVHAHRGSARSTLCSAPNYFARGTEGEEEKKRRGGRATDCQQLLLVSQMGGPCWPGAEKQLRAKGDSLSDATLYP